MRRETKANDFSENDGKNPLLYASTSPKAAIVAEIATRFLELEEMERNCGIILLRELYGLSNASKPGFRLVCEILSGNPEALESTAKKAVRRGVKKDTVRTVQKKAVARIEKENPEISNLIKNFLRQNENRIVYN